MLKKIIIAIILMAVIWFGGFCFYIYDLLYFDCQRTNTADGIVVLTGGRGRIECGLNLLQHNKAPRLLISGVHKNYNIQRTLNDQMVSLKQRIELAYAALTTVENSFEAFFWVHKHNIHSFYLVTSDYHMRRAQLDFAITLQDLQIYPCPVAVTKVSTMSIDGLMRLCHEYHKLLITWLHFQINKSH